MRRAISHPSGFTLLETTLAVTLLAIALLVLTTTYGSASKVANDAHFHVRASAENRRSLTAVANVLRGADLNTIVGFDSMGQAKALTFSRVEGATLSARTHAPSEVLTWESGSVSVAGVPIGQVALLASGVKSTLAKHVPQNGFVVTRKDDTLVIQLTTSYPRAGPDPLEVRGRTAVTLRN